MAEANNEQTTVKLVDVYKEGKILLKDLISFKLGQNLPPVNATALALRKLSKNIELKNPYLLWGMCTKLDFSEETLCNSFSRVAKEMFADSIINWSKIATLLAFVAHVAKYCIENHMSEQRDLIAEWTARFVTEMNWIDKQGGWNCLIN